MYLFNPHRSGPAEQQRMVTKAMFTQLTVVHAAGQLVSCTSFIVLLCCQAPSYVRLHLCFVSIVQITSSKRKRVVMSLQTKVQACFVNVFSYCIAYVFMNLKLYHMPPFIYNIVHIIRCNRLWAVVHGVRLRVHQLSFNYKSSNFISFIEYLLIQTCKLSA